MVTFSRKFLLTLLFVALAIYVVVLNNTPTTVYLPFISSEPFTQNTGVVLITAFTAGVLCAAAVALLFGIRAHFREQRLHYREKQRGEFYAAMVKARSFLAAEEWLKARDQWEHAVRKDPTDIIARLELARSLRGSGDLREALKVLDAARAVEPHNVEILIRAAEVNLALNNKTAALDNLALVLFHSPNWKAAKLACQLSEDIGRIDDATEYNREYGYLSGDSEIQEATRVRLAYKQILHAHGETHNTLHTELKAFLKKNPGFVPALHKLAELEQESGNIEDAAQLLVSAAKADGTGACWDEAVHLWLDNNMPDRALSAARTAAKETSGSARLHAEINLIRLLLLLGMNDEARKRIEDFASIAKSCGAEPPREMRQTLLILKGLALCNLGKHLEAAEIWKCLNEHDFEWSDPVLARGAAVNGDAPPPRLSTP